MIAGVILGAGHGGHGGAAGGGAGQGVGIDGYFVGGAGVSGVEAHGFQSLAFFAGGEKLAI